MLLPSKYVLRQCLIVIAVNLSAIGVGIGVSWTSPMLVKLMKEDTQLSRRITEEDATWLVSCGFLLPIVFCHIIPWMTNLLGRKKMILILSLIKVCANMMLIFANELWMLYIIRGICGVADVAFLNNMPAYSAEIASKEIRGALGTIGQISIATGMLIMFSVGPYVSYLAVNIVYESVTFLVILPLLLVPESPCSLLRKGQANEALKTMIYLRGSEISAKEEIQELTTSSEQSHKAALFRDKVFLKALGISIVLNIGLQSVGYLTIAMYLQTILDTTGTSVSSEVMSVIFGVMQLVAGFCTAILSDKAGRKPILSITLLGVSLGMAGLGVFFYVKESGAEIKGAMNYLPLISLVIIVCCFNAGPGSLTSVICAELFDSPARSFGISIGMTFGISFAFINVKYFPSLSTAIGSAAVFWMFSVISIVIMMFVLICVPETKQRSFLEIQKALGRKIDETPDNMKEV